MNFIIATNNPGKMAEMRRILTRMGHTAQSQREAGITLEPEENGTSFAENALIKARAIAQASGQPTIADDSGLCVDALNGAPGVFSARYCGCHGDDEANNDKLLEALSQVPAAMRSAQFVSCVCVYLPKAARSNGADSADNWQRNMTCEGVCPGEIGFVRAGTNGFGYDPLFVPLFVGVGPEKTVLNTEKRTYAQLSADEKDAISHRGEAMRSLARELPAFLRGSIEDTDARILGAACGPTAIFYTDEAAGDTTLVWQEAEQKGNHHHVDK
ncbi:MAG: RdgB/HAM1 family non-canonical purine NTP pyrophosphatase [Ruthenibacterium sp.]